MFATGRTKMSPNSEIPRSSIQRPIFFPTLDTITNQTNKNPQQENKIETSRNNRLTLDDDLLDEVRRGNQAERAPERLVEDGAVDLQLRGHAAVDDGTAAGCGDEAVDGIHRRRRCSDHHFRRGVGVGVGVYIRYEGV